MSAMEVRNGYTALHWCPPSPTLFKAAQILAGKNITKIRIPNFAAIIEIDRLAKKPKGPRAE